MKPTTTAAFQPKTTTTVITPPPPPTTTTQKLTQQQINKNETCQEKVDRLRSQPLTVGEYPQCSADGNYDHIQKSWLTDSVFCVHTKSGVEIDNTRSKPVSSNIICPCKYFFFWLSGNILKALAIVPGTLFLDCQYFSVIERIYLRYQQV